MYVLFWGAIKQTKTRHIIIILHMHHRCAPRVIYHGAYVSLFHIIHAKTVQSEKTVLRLRCVRVSTDKSVSDGRRSYNPGILRCAYGYAGSVPGSRDRLQTSVAGKETIADVVFAIVILKIPKQNKFEIDQIYFF